MTAIVILLLVVGAVYFASRHRRSAPQVSATPLVARVEFLERRVQELQFALDKLRMGGAPAHRPAAAPEPKPPPRPQPVAPPPPPVAEPLPAAPRSFDWGRTVSTADLLGAKALAFAGGVVTLLGIVFFFVLAVNRGWIGPELRVACGALASALVFG